MESCTLGAALGLSDTKDAKFEEGEADGAFDGRAVGIDLGIADLDGRIEGCKLGSTLGKLLLATMLGQKLVARPGL